MKMHEDFKVDVKNTGDKFDLKKPENALSAEVHSLLDKGSHVQDDSVNRAVVGKALERSGVLPNLLVSEMPRLDTDGSGYVSRRELQQQATGPKENPVTAAAAQHALNNFEEIRRSGSWLQRQFHSSDSLSANQLQAYAREMQNNPPQPQAQTKF